MRTDAIFSNQFNFTADVSKLVVRAEAATFDFVKQIKCIVSQSSSSGLFVVTKEPLALSDRLNNILDPFGQRLFPEDSTSRNVYVNVVQPQFGYLNKIVGYKSIVKDILPPSYADLVNSLNLTLGN